MDALKVLLPVDLQDRQSALNEVAKAMQYLADRSVKMHFLSILPGKPVPLIGSLMPSEDLVSALAVLEEELLLLVKEALPQLEGFTVRALEGSIHKEILKYASAVDADLIVLPSHSHSKVENILIGSVTSKVVEKANCSVLVVR